MSDKIKSLRREIRSLEERLENEFDRKRAAFQFRLENRRIIFEKEIVRQHRQLKRKLWRYIVGARPLIALTAPFIYSLILAFVFLDLLVTIYQAVCFPIYGLKKVRRQDYIVLDRHHLAYLNGLEKLNCAYCSYSNGLIAYVGEIASRTESYWCPIKHARRMSGAHNRYHEFVEYGDAAGYQSKMRELTEGSHNTKT